MTIEAPRHMATAAAQSGHDPSDPGLSYPIHRSVAFAHDDGPTLAQAMAGNGAFVYARQANPTVAKLEETVAELDAGAAAVATGSGMAALTLAIFSALESGGSVIAPRVLYGGTVSLLHRLGSRLGVQVRLVDGLTPQQLRAADVGRHDVVIAEVITNPTIRVEDVPRVAQVCGDASALLIVDNALAGPAVCRPLLHGADVVVHSATKWLAGHSDVMAGCATFANPALAARARAWRTDLGCVLDPQAAWLTLRGIQTTCVRADRVADTARSLHAEVARLVAVRSVTWPGAADHPDHDLATKLLDRPPGVLAIDLDRDQVDVEAFMATLSVVRLAPSLGGSETLLLQPASTSHRDLAASQRAASGITPELVRLSVGLEDPRDLIDDIATALKTARRRPTQ